MQYDSIGIALKFWERMGFGKNMFVFFLTLALSYYSAEIVKVKVF